MSFQRLYPPPAFVIITWYLPFDNSCTSGFGVFGLPNTRIGASAPMDSAWRSESSAVRAVNAVALGIRSWSKSMVAWNMGSDSNRLCIGRSRST